MPKPAVKRLKSGYQRVPGQTLGKISVSHTAGRDVYFVTANLKAAGRQFQKHHRCPQLHCGFNGGTLSLIFGFGIHQNQIARFRHFLKSRVQTQFASQSSRHAGGFANDESSTRRCFSQRRKNLNLLRVITNHFSAGVGQGEPHAGVHAGIHFRQFEADDSLRHGRALGDFRFDATGLDDFPADLQLVTDLRTGQNFMRVVANPRFHFQGFAAEPRVTVGAQRNHQRLQRIAVGEVSRLGRAVHIHDGFHPAARPGVNKKMNRKSVHPRVATKRFRHEARDPGLMLLTRGNPSFRCGLRGIPEVLKTVRLRLCQFAWTPRGGFFIR